jgi:hypothetical protein
MHARSRKNLRRHYARIVRRCTLYGNRVSAMKIGSCLQEIADGRSSGVEAIISSHEGLYWRPQGIGAGSARERAIGTS